MVSTIKGKKSSEKFETLSNRCVCGKSFVTLFSTESKFYHVELALWWTETDDSKWHQEELSIRAVLGTKEDGARGQVSREGGHSAWLKWDASHIELRSLRPCRFGRRYLVIAGICLCHLISSQYLWFVTNSTSQVLVFHYCHSNPFQRPNCPSWLAGVWRSGAFNQATQALIPLSVSMVELRAMID